VIAASASASANTNADAAELRHFSALAARWWDPNGPSKPLIALNPVRLGFMQSHLALRDKNMLDVGCGGGLLSEALALAGARVSGIDLSEDLLEVARLHALETGVTVDYQNQSAEQFASTKAHQFHAISCMEMLEHVPDPASVIRACGQMLLPGGWLFLSTINRTTKSFAQAIVAAEYVLSLVPKGTHHFDKFISPSELAAVLRAAGFEVRALKGMRYQPFSNKATLSDDYQVNYLMAAQKL
jgi:2-polyprenyl-6-hydroxyphenyl methylase / 3-demethylubiquinone-9 3-methyltransferase